MLLALCESTACEGKGSANNPASLPHHTPSPVGRSDYFLPPAGARSLTFQVTLVSQIRLGLGQETKVCLLKGLAATNRASPGPCCPAVQPTPATPFPPAGGQTLIASSREGSPPGRRSSGEVRTRACPGLWESRLSKPSEHGGLRIGKHHFPPRQTRQGSH